jgi:hypothetical protein
MPTYLHACDNPDCPTEEWEDYYSIASEPQIECPTCHQNGHRLIGGGGSGRGIVSLTGNDLVNKVKSDAKALENVARHNENFAANFVSPDIYEKKQSQIDQAKKDGSFRRKDW